jgi:hypothetical protein
MPERRRGESKNAWWAVGLAAICIGVSVNGAGAQARIASLEERFAGAERVVVAEARSVSAMWRQNDRGDRIIVSRVLLDVGETLKGASTEQVWMEVDGGTVDGITLEVSSVPLMHQGERAVFFLDSGEGNVHRPFLKGQGILSLDSDEMVRGSSLHLNQIRRMSRGGR